MNAEQCLGTTEHHRKVKSKYCSCPSDGNSPVKGLHLGSLDGETRINKQGS